MDAPLAALKIKRITHNATVVTGGEEREREREAATEPQTVVARRRQSQD